MSIKSDLKPTKNPISGLLPFQYLGTDSMIFWLIVIIELFSLLLLLLLAVVLGVLPQINDPDASVVLVIDTFLKISRTFLLSQNFILKVIY